MNISKNIKGALGGAMTALDIIFGRSRPLFVQNPSQPTGAPLDPEDILEPLESGSREGTLMSVHIRTDVGLQLTPYHKGINALPRNHRFGGNAVAVAESSCEQALANPNCGKTCS